MSTTRRHGRIVGTAERGLSAVAVAAYRRPFAALALIVALGAGAAYFASRLEVNADLAELLPEAFPSVRAFDALKRRFGGSGFVVVVGYDAEPEALERFARDVAPKLEALPDVRYVDYQRPVSFFEDHALYFLDRSDLETLRDRLQKREAYEKRKANPLYLDFEDSEPPPLDFSDLGKKYAGRGDRKWVLAQFGEHYYIDRQHRMIVLLAKPASASLDLSYAKEVVGQVKQLVGGLDLSAYGPHMKVGYTGRYTKRVDQQALIQRDLTISSTVAFLLILLYLVFHFRRLLAVLLVAVPLAVGLLWTFGFAGGAFGVLNILTAFIGAILLGLGIDHGIHLLGRYEAEHAARATREEAVRATFGNTGRAVVVAALTTTVGFAGLSFSEFRAFHEFGIIAATGMLLVMAAYIVCLPALLSLAARAGWSPRAQAREEPGGFARALPRWSSRVLLVSLAVVVFGLVMLPRAHFNYDLDSLEDSSIPSFRLDHDTNRILGYSQTPVAVLTRTLTEEREIASQLRAQQARLGDQSTIDFIAASADLVPDQQEEKLPVIEQIGKIVGKVKPQWVAPDLRRYVGMLHRMTAAKPFTTASLPDAVTRQFRGKGSDAGEGFVFIFPGISLSNGDDVSRFAREVRSVPALAGKADVVAGEPMILADIIEMVSREAPPVMIGTVIAVFLTSLLLLGRIRNTLLGLLPAAVTMVVTLGLMPIVGLDLNYVNIVMIPILFGIGVDGGVHLVVRMASGQPLQENLTETGRAITGSLLTSALGFGSLQLADHPGLDSLGDLAVLGLAVNLLACLVVLPALLAWVSRRRGVVLQQAVAADGGGELSGEDGQPEE